MGLIRNIKEGVKKSRIDRLRDRLKWKQKEIELKFNVHKNSHSLFWVWEFSKKAVLICFLFYVIVQIYSMYVMFTYADFSHLGDLINQTGEILQNCVFAYLIKAGLENIGKIVFTKKENKDDAVG